MFIHYEFIYLLLVMVMFMLMLILMFVIYGVSSTRHVVVALQFRIIQTNILLIKYLALDISYYLVKFNLEAKGIITIDLIYHN